MSAESPGARAVASYELHEIFLVAAQFEVNEDLIPSNVLPALQYFHRIGVAKILGQVRQLAESEQPPMYVMRYLITGEVRVLKPGKSFMAEPIPDDDVLAQIRHTFAADYTCPESIHQDQSMAQAFGRNAVFHAWPYFREAVHAASLRLRIPPLTLPMLKPGGMTVPPADGAVQQ